MRHITFFGGQGSRSLFSRFVASSSKRAATASDTVSLLLSSCHAAFLSELLHLRSLGPVPSWAVLDGIQTPFDLLSVPEQYHKNPVIQGVVLCTHQLIQYLHSEQAGRDETRSELAGLCSGMLPAVVVACSRDVTAFISWAKEAVRLAFWIGYRAGQLSAQLESHEWQLYPWSLAVVGLEEVEMQRILSLFESILKKAGLEATFINLQATLKLFLTRK
ncbi:uncharacterized protein DSM5745_05796 [Aspergillus mulundensis]|uniref:Starter acyltransferase (SAT) domain-containing protein n=1 Tax=Aspergillus mulundensis TaxID=1810919 RepID=A0A3D8RYK9_9EURO|nr:hypothetical protein DSM5745_05796 [Aspergillus mulundensis]RDW78944.1 hypothetical protein DSM5745_05796 [Aspergillus mulundensis]